MPTEWQDHLYFGPCKKPMRPRMEVGDYVFGISPSGYSPRRVLYCARVEECITYREAYCRFSALHGPVGPIHVRPVNGAGAFPDCEYEPISHPAHANDWRADLATPDLDRFFIFEERDGWRGRWLGTKGPAVDEEILAVLNDCALFGASGRLGQNTGTLKIPIAYSRLTKGLHLETEAPERLLSLCAERLRGVDFDGEPEEVAPRLLASCYRKSRCSHRPPRPPRRAGRGC